MNVIVIAARDADGKKLDVGVYGKSPHIMEVGDTTWREVFLPLFRSNDVEDDDVYNYDLFGQFTDVVPKIYIRKKILE